MWPSLAASTKYKLGHLWTQVSCADSEEIFPRRFHLKKASGHYRVIKGLSYLPLEFTTQASITCIALKFLIFQNPQERLCNLGALNNLACPTVQSHSTILPEQHNYVCQRNTLFQVPISVLFRVFLAVIKHHDQRNSWRKGFMWLMFPKHCLWLKEVSTETRPR